ncbi:hypothetical protein KC19_1G090000 [Ceratodon purpureus]|uniref:RING-type domain-containing protein n=1 Tax=Ceratodon purpureus TaxID=3225 RepID=A0A8T0J311_CERPU|nr:hypothetical protein KC19_1G090000 [Ceratodon purpureus]
MEDEKELRILDKDLEFGEHILSRESARTEELRKEQQGLEEDLKKIEREITLRGMGAVRAELWLAKLTDQVQLMAEGSGMGTTPLPIRNPRQPEQGRTMVVYLENCPVCGYNFKCLNASIADCGCVYHHFCLAAWLSDGRRQCAYRGCEKEFCSDWMASFGANQVRIPPLRQPKQEGLLGTLNRVESGNVGAAASTNFQVPSASGTPVSQGHQGPGTPSSGQLGTPASGSWRTPTGSVGRINAVGKSMQMGDVPSRSLGRTPKSGSRSNLGSGTGRTSDDSIVFGDDDVCLSQAPGASFPALEGVRGSVGETIIPETMAMTGDGVLATPEEPAPQTGIPNLVLSDDEDVDVPEPESERTLPDRAMGQGTEKDSSPASKGVLEWALPATEFQALDGDTVSAEIQAEPGSSPTVEKKTSQGARPHSTRRQAALHNKLCPSPTVTPGSTSDAGREPVTKKANLGRGRTIQGAARGEKGTNMKPLAQIGLQEKFRAPAVVSDGGKGRGRGGKVAKRKRD